MKIVEAPYCMYWEDADILDVICGDQPCTTGTSWYAGAMVMKGVDILQKMHEENFAPGGDSFAGIQFWGGVRSFLSHNYMKILGRDYDRYRAEHNSQEWTVPVSDIVEFLLQDERGLVLPPWSQWEERVMRALREQRPQVHIPLLEL